ncbi:hypothetical protein [uncultured Oscillibacter sp.]|uniref:hypothetical protein n=1 Tax=uncultured Oscillibacter sp. TaxID=876091 RepID=UPI0025D31E63|nr:hypothetical protein [uncultured Oscillibacter sp.]
MEMSMDGTLDVWAEDSKEYKPGDQAWSTEFRKNIRDGALAFAEQYNAGGGNAVVFDLPKEGITGNSHFLFRELNNAEIADHVEAWIQANVEQ